jgi:glutamine synthetase
MLMAALDGIENKIDPGKPLDENIYELSGKEKARIKNVPGTLSESLMALQKDFSFLTKGGVFTDDVIETYIDYKMKNEILELSLRPHPFEFALYYDN